MSSFKVTAHVRVSGPIVDGSAETALHDWLRATVEELTSRGTRRIRAAADAMDRSGRGGTGRAAAGLIIYDRDLTQTIFGEMKKGEVWWPWLEGTSSRNRTTRFKGYHTFRDTARGLDDEAGRVAEEKLAEYLPRMGGA